MTESLDRHRISDGDGHQVFSSFDRAGVDRPCEREPHARSFWNWLLRWRAIHSYHSHRSCRCTGAKPHHALPSL